MDGDGFNIANNQYQPNNQGEKCKIELYNLLDTNQIKITWNNNVYFIIQSIKNQSLTEI